MKAEERVINQLASQMLGQLLRAESLLDELEEAKARIAELEKAAKTKS